MILWLRTVWRWLTEANVFWLLAFVMIGTSVVAFWGDTTEVRVRRTGWALELLGLATVAWGIRNTRRSFEHPDIFSLSKTWLARFPKYPKPSGITVTIHAVEEHDTAHAIVHVGDAGAVPSLKDRVEILERSVYDITEQLNKTRHDLTHEIEDSQTALSKERQSREEQGEKLKQKLEDAETGGLHVSATGLVWLALGLTLSTIPDDLLVW